MHGAWTQAEQEARKACDELQGFQITGTAGLGFDAIGHSEPVEVASIEWR